MTLSVGLETCGPKWDPDFPSGRPYGNFFLTIQFLPVSYPRSIFSEKLHESFSPNLRFGQLSVTAHGWAAGSSNNGLFVLAAKKRDVFSFYLFFKQNVYFYVFLVFQEVICYFSNNVLCLFSSYIV